MLLNHLFNEYINFVTIAVCKKYQVLTTPLSTSTTVSNIAGVNSIVIFRAKFLQKKKEAGRQRQIILENFGMSLLHPRPQRQVQVTQISKIGFMVK